MILRLQTLTLVIMLGGLMTPAECCARGILSELFYGPAGVFSSNRKRDTWSQDQQYVPVSAGCAPSITENASPLPEYEPPLPEIVPTAPPQAASISAPAPAAEQYVPLSPARAPSPAEYVPVSHEYPPPSPARAPSPAEYVPVSHEYPPPSPARAPSPPEHVPAFHEYVPPSPARAPSPPEHVPAIHEYTSPSPARAASTPESVPALYERGPFSPEPAVTPVEYRSASSSEECVPFAPGCDASTAECAPSAHHGLSSSSGCASGCPSGCATCSAGCGHSWSDRIHGWWERQTRAKRRDCYYGCMEAQRKFMNPVCVPACAPYFGYYQTVWRPFCTTNPVFADETTPFLEEFPVESFDNFPSPAEGGPAQ